MKKIVIAADSFKGSISSDDFAQVCKEAILEKLPDCEIACVTLADGGEGTCDALCKAYNAKAVEITVTGPLGQTLTARYAISTDSKTAIIEMAAAAGLPLLSLGQRNPLNTTTFGVGQMIADAINKGCRRIVVGIGGSATNDAGMGMLRALGYKFYDASGRELDGRGADLLQVAKIDDSGALPELKTTEFFVACDVDNPFCGPEGAACVFAPQKGADAEAVRLLDDGLTNFARVVNESCGADIAAMPGAGAAGGLGGAFAAFLGGRLQSGVDLVLDACDFNNLISDADLIITGEGCLDSQSCRGKALSGVISRASAVRVPVVALAGSVEPCREIEQMGFAGIFSIQQRPVGLEEALRPDVTRANLHFTTRQVLNLIIKQRP